MLQKFTSRFIAERPSIGLSFFRIAVAVTVGCHVLPALAVLKDTFLAGAFKTVNTNFFPIWFLDLVAKSPDWLVILAAVVFVLSWLGFLLGLYSQASCLVMTGACYYFYALNNFEIGTLSWDILLVTLFLMCVSPYHGDYFSFDCLRKKREKPYARCRPFFVLELLKMQFAFTYFYTGLYKITASGNWLTDNPIYYLMNYPPAGVTKDFFLKGFLAHHPDISYALGVVIVFVELSMPFMLYHRRLKYVAIGLGFVFHIALLVAFDVPAIFFFLFPPALLLFIEPEDVLEKIRELRQVNEGRPKAIVVYDGQCGFCRFCIEKLKIMDLFNRLAFVNFNDVTDFVTLHPKLNLEAAKSQIQLITSDGNLYGGFFAVRRLYWLLPMLYAFLPIVYFPGMAMIGQQLYRLVAKNRYLLHQDRFCKDNRCFR